MIYYIINYIMKNKIKYKIINKYLLYLQDINKLIVDLTIYDSLSYTIYDKYKYIIFAFPYIEFGWNYYLLTSLIIQYIDIRLYNINNNYKK